MLMRYYYTKLSYYLQKDIMSSNKGPFHNEYSVVEIIKSRKGKKTCIVHNSIGQYYIAKKFQMNDMYALNQIGLMKTIRHPNVVGFHDIVMEKGHAYLIEEYCQEGDLAFHIRRQVRKKRSYFSERTIAKWLLQLLLALEYLHNKKIMHRDIRPQNIFLTSLGNLKLGCFRSSKMFDNQSSLSSTILTSPYYMAPECIQSHGYDQKVDIWAFGSLLYQICSLKAAFSDKNIASQVNMILKGQNKQLPSVYSKQLCQIYNKCLIKKSKDRPSAKALLRQNYFLEQMKKFVTEKPQTSIRIPIKHYNVHFNILANKKKQKDPKSLRQTIKASKKLRENQRERQPKVYTPVLPKIEQAHKIERRNSKSVQKYRNREEPRGPTFVQIQKQKSIDKGRQKQRQSSKQMVRDKSRQLLTRKKSSNKIEKFIVNSPNNPSKKQKDVQRKQSADGKKTDRTITITQQYLQSPKKNLMAPPILPRPGKQKEKKEGQKISQSKEQMNFSQTKKKEGLAYQLSLIQKENAKMFDKEEIQSSLTKIFEDLNIKQQEQEQFSFELEDQSLARLTLKKNQGSELIQTYKTKLHQLIQEINYKYCPNMEPIQQRTQEFDSNTFANLKRN